MFKDTRSKRRQFIVVGLTQFGRTVAKTLYTMGMDVLCIDQDESKIQEIADHVTHAVTADASDEAVLQSLGSRNFDVAIVCMDNDIEASIMVTLALKDAGVQYLVVKAVEARQKRALYKLGADRVVMPDKDMGERVAYNIAASNLIDYIELSEKYSVFEIMCPKKWEQKSMIELDVRQVYGVIILGINRKDEFILLTETAVQFEQGDIIILLGSKKDFTLQLQTLD